MNCQVEDYYWKAVERSGMAPSGVEVRRLVGFDVAQQCAQQEPADGLKLYVKSTKPKAQYYSVLLNPAQCSCSGHFQHFPSASPFAALSEHFQSSSGILICFNDNIIIELNYIFIYMIIT